MRIRVAFAAAFVVLLGACGGGRSDEAAVPTVEALAASKGGGAAVKVTSLSIAPTTIAVLGVPITLTVQAKDKSGRIVSVVPAWSSADPTIATVDAAGQVAPLRAGYTRITASAGGVSATTLLSVRGPVPLPVRSTQVGMNLAGVAYYATEFPFADLMKSGMGWVSMEDDGTWNAAFPALTADGYPASLKAGQHAVSAVAWQNAGHPAGRYVVLWDGDGTIGFPMSRAPVVESGANRVVVDVQDTSVALWVSIDRTNPANPVRNVRVLLPGTEATYRSQPFNVAFLKKVAPFSLLRFMDWGMTNGSPVAAWADRARTTDVTYGTQKGVPLEVMIDLANTLHVDPWFCIPHQATDDYVTRFAQLLRDRLDPTLRPHIEYSNEVWNTGFGQTAWAVAQSQKLGLATPYGQPSAWYAQRAVQVFKLVQQVYGADSGRLVRVLAGQAAWTQFLENALATSGVAANTDVLAVAPYFQAEAAGDPANVEATLQLTPDQLVDQMVANLNGPVKGWIAQNAALAKRYGLKLKGYEGGPGDSTAYFPPDRIDALTTLFAAAHRHPRMRGVVSSFYESWIAAGGDALNFYNDVGPWTKWGFWGALETVGQDPATAPKYQGLLDVVAAHPATP